VADDHQINQSQILSHAFDLSLRGWNQKKEKGEKYKKELRESNLWYADASTTSET
jgi:hypothetical protein